MDGGPGKGKLPVYYGGGLAEKNCERGV